MTTTDPRARLSEIKALAEEYRPTMDIEVVHDWAGEAVNDTIDAYAALTEVLNLHNPTHGYWGEKICAECSDDDSRVEYSHPCPTVRALTESLGGDRG